MFVFLPALCFLKKTTTNFIHLPHSISTQKLVSLFSLFPSPPVISEFCLTARRLIQRRCWHRSLRELSGLQPPRPHSEKVLERIPDIGQQRRPAGSLQPLAWACSGKISLSAPEILLLRQPPVGRERKKKRKTWLKKVETQC